MKTKKWIISSVCCLLPMIIGLILYPNLPKQLPIHFDANGIADNYAAKEISLFVLPIGMAVLNYIVGWFMMHDPKHKNKNNIMMELPMYLLPILTIMIYICVVMYGFKQPINTSFIMTLLMGFIFLVIGNFLPKCQQSYTVGIKTPWALEDEENWRKTHRLGGFLWSMTGIIVILNTIFFEMNVYLFVGVIVVTAIIPFIYSYMLYAKGEK